MVFKADTLQIQRTKLKLEEKEKPYHKNNNHS